MVIVVVDPLVVLQSESDLQPLKRMGHERYVKQVKGKLKSEILVPKLIMLAFICIEKNNCVVILLAKQIGKYHNVVYHCENYRYCRYVVVKVF